MIREDAPTMSTGPAIAGTGPGISGAPDENLPHWKGKKKQRLRQIVKRKELQNEGIIDTLKKGAKAVGGAIKDVAKDELEKTFGKFGSAVRKRMQNGKR